MNDLFIAASRGKWRFASSKGGLTVEQLWDMPLLGKGGFDLNTVAQFINQALRALGEESFVTTGDTKERVALTAKLDLVKFIIATKQAEAAANEKRVAKAAERRRLMEILAQKEDEELRGSSREDIMRRLEALDAE